ncbi:MAG: hypothetical protein DRO12_01210 [Thermoprotei archaeon]|nr:MAG: hypothetical protein DRO12_01210 [Thermoprotei archaeon]
MKTLKVKARIFRFDPAKDEGPWFAEYVVEVDESASILDLLLEIKKKAPDLAVPYSCRVGRCGSCAVVVNGIPVLACQTPVKRFGHMLEISPLPGFRVLKDLVVDNSGILRVGVEVLSGYLRRTQPYVPPEKIPHNRVEYLHEFKQCIACGACLAACPVYSIDKHRFGGPHAMRILAQYAEDPRDGAPRVEEAALRGLYMCLTCGNCQVVCPHEIAIHRGVLALRRKAYSAERAPFKLVDVIDAIEDPETGNPLYMPRTERGAWIKGLRPTPNARTLVFAGCMASYADRGSVRALALLLELAGVEYQVLGSEELCCGMPIFLAGSWEKARKQAEKLAKMLKSRGIDVVVTPCPSCYRMLRKEYPEVLGVELEVEVLHATQLLLDLLRKGRLKIRKRVELVVTYHDPCDLGRHMGVYDEPREILRTIPGVKLVEMLRGRYREYSRCCGAGGDLKIVDPELSLRIASERLSDVPRDAQVVLHACPTCKIQFTEASTRIGTKLQNISVQELLLTVVGGDDE